MLRKLARQPTLKVRKYTVTANDPALRRTLKRQVAIRLRAARGAPQNGPP